MVNSIKSQTLVLHQTHDVRWETREVKAPGPLEARIHIQCIGICGSDLHYYTHGRIGSFVVENPLVLGHEVSGIVEAIGEQVTRLKIGDRVALEPGIPCGRCDYCKRGSYNLCPKMRFMATPPIDGALSEYVIWPEDFIFPIPEHVSLEAAALLEPLAVAVWAVQRGGVSMGDSVVVLGAGPIGCTTLQAAKAAGATIRIAVDLEPFRLEMAKQMGATHTINAQEEDVLERIRDITTTLDLPRSHAGVDVAFETAGSVATCRMSLAAPRPGGVTVLVGLPPDPLISLDIVSAASRETQVRGLFRYANCYPESLALVASGAVNLDALVTQNYAFSQTPAALEFAVNDKSSSMKVMIQMNQDNHAPR